MGKVVFAGCSYTAGDGWQNQSHPDLWVNLCHKNITQLQTLELVNAGISGGSNTQIFENVIRNIDAEVKILICQWTAMPRYNFSVGFELWSTQEQLQSLNGKRNDTGINLNNGESYSRQYLDNLLDRLLVLHHLHGEILKVVRYSSTISKLCDQLKIKVSFINGICPWDNNYFLRLHNVLPEEYTEFTKTKILNIQTRSDEDIYKLYNQLHNEYAAAGGIDPAKWINLYTSMRRTQIDTNADHLHPGVNSNFQYFQQVTNFLNQ